jgi:hypothetical protein
MSPIRIPDRRSQLDAMIPSAQRRIAGGITGHLATSPLRRRISRRRTGAAGLSGVTRWAYFEGGNPDV